MPWTNKHVGWLKRTRTKITIACGAKVPIWEFRHTHDQGILSAWAKHFRNHYCLDSEIDALRNGTPHSRSAYLNSIKFPDSAQAPGPSIRAGDWAEILVADYLQFILEFWVPRNRYSDKTIRNESEKGTDIIGFKIIDPAKVSKGDILALFEAKAQLSSATQKSRLQDAIDGSAKDQLRKAESLNAIKQRLLIGGDMDGKARVERFQNPEDLPYTEQYGAVAVFSTTAYDAVKERKATCASHPAVPELLIIRGKDLMALVHALYERAANEA